MARLTGRPIGSPCCDDDAEREGKVKVKVLRFATGRAWAVGAESRWTLASMHSIRWTVLEIAGSVLRRGLHSMRDDLALRGHDAIAMLERMTAGRLLEATKKVMKTNRLKTRYDMFHAFNLFSIGFRSGP